MKIILTYTELVLKDIGDAKKGMNVPGEVSIEQVLKIDYGNYGDEKHRHHWPGMHNESSYGWPFPVIIIHTKDFGRIVTISPITFWHYPD